MIFRQRDATSEEGVGWLRYAISNRMGWIFREQPTQDKGVDAQVEEVVDNRATGRLIGLQIKSGESWFKNKTKSGYRFYGDLDHLAYWQGHSLPILIVLFDPRSSEAYWQWVVERNVETTSKAWTINVPFANKIDNKTAAAWHSICQPENAKKFERRKRRFAEIANAFDSFPEQRQTLLYDALNHSSKSIFLSTPYISTDILSVLDAAASRCRVRVAIGTNQAQDVVHLAEARCRPGFEIRVVRNLHLKMSLFDSLFLIEGSANLTSIGIVRPNEKFSIFVDERKTEDAIERFLEVWREGGAVALKPSYGIL